MKRSSRKNRRPRVCVCPLGEGSLGVSSIQAFDSNQSFTVNFTEVLPPTPPGGFHFLDALVNGGPLTNLTFGVVGGALVASFQESLVAGDNISFFIGADGSGLVGPAGEIPLPLPASFVGVVQ